MKILNKTQSICNYCHKPVDAYYVEIDKRVYFQKECEEHGKTKALVAENVQDYLKWTSNPVINIPPKEAITKGKEGECPLHCGVCDKHLQTACCVLLDITERCNQNCPYCFAKANEDADKDPSLEEIERWYDKLVELGEERPFNIQLSGGEPTVRDDLLEIIKIGRDKGFEYIQINTNGRRIALEEGYAKKLKEAGASVIFLQFDGTKDEIYKELRGEPLLNLKKKAIKNCRKAGLPVTLVPMVVKHVNLDNIGEMLEFLLENVDVVKGIHFQPVSFFGRHPDDEDNGDFENRVTMFETMHEIEKQTDGRFKYSDIYPISTGHSLCCFCGSYLKEDKGNIKSLIGEKAAIDGIGCCDAMDPLEIIKKDRDYVLNKWDMPQQNEPDPYPCCGWETDLDNDKEYPGWETQSEVCCCLDDAQSFDDVLAYLKRNMFTISGMAFQDVTNLDAERVKRCRVQVLTKDERLIPFCGYNSIYRGNV
ncbi:radical SAM (seleno)protein TrsS [Anaerovorax odorimutans]|uniref:radical SAM (seleno)protein TrsS n=1 Tax=Anaerovorax odorimutans TaxID=109327 RepID=UPI00040B68AF|nr:radical SAM (seleno)protein TrsS [Anaerovorax odorimutans]